MKNTLIITLLGFISSYSFSQSNVITTSVPILGITPDARSSGMGEVGVATSADNYSSYWNLGKVTFTDNKGGISGSYSPYLRSLSKGMNFLNLSGYFKTDYNSAASYNARYLNMTEVIYRDENGIETGLIRPADFTVGGGYSLRLSENLGIGLGAKYIHSSVASIDTENQPELKSAHAFSVDVGAYYEKYIVDTKLAFGLAINNVGSKIKYSDTEPSFQPMNLKLGVAANFLAGVNGSLTVALDITKPLTPTPPMINENGEIIEGQSMNKSVMKSIITSFHDAPNGFSGTMQALTYGMGLEYDYANQFFLRGGFVYENRNKGAKRYGTLGAGFKYHNFGIDAAYLLPIDQNSFYKNSMKFTLSFTLN